MAQNSRPARWRALVSELQAQRALLEDAIAKYNDTMNNLRDLQSEYEEWKDRLPENLQSSPLGERLEEVCGISLEDLDEPDFGPLDEAENIDLPRGFGRD